MIDHLGLGRLAVLLVLGLLVFGPERLPDMATRAGKTLHQLRQTLHNMTAEIKDSMGPEISNLDLTTLNPRTILTNLITEEPTTPTPPPPTPETIAQLAIHTHLTPQPTPTEPTRV